MPRIIVIVICHYNMCMHANVTKLPVRHFARFRPNIVGTMSSNPTDRRRLFYVSIS